MKKTTVGIQVGQYKKQKGNILLQSYQNEQSQNLLHE